MGRTIDEDERTGPLRRSAVSQPVGADAARPDSRPGFVVRFVPMDVTVRVPPARRLYDVAMGAGLPLAQSCRGEGICGRCGVRVLEGQANVGPEGQPERRRKVDNRVDPTLRLACLTTVRGDLVVTTDYW